MNNILVPTDFSERALNAARFAIRLAQQSNATVYLFHAYTGFRSGFQSETGNERDESRAADEAKAEMRRFSADVSKFAFAVDVRPVCRKGTLLQVIQELTREASIDLIVMGTDGASGLKYQFIGTNTFNVAETLDIPLLAVPTGTADFDIKTIGFFSDYRPEDHQTVISLYSLFGSDQIRYLVTHIHEKDTPPKDTDVKKLAAWAMELQANTPIRDMDWELLTGKEDIAVIREFVSTFSVDLLAITLAERNFLDRLLDKSLAKEIVMQSKTPVFIGR